MTIQTIARAGVIALVVSALPATLAAAPKEPLTFYGLKFPDKIAGAQRGDPHDYEKTSPGFGYGVQYDAPGWAITVYIYDRGKSSIPSDPRSEIIKNELEAAKREVYEVRSNVELKRDFLIEGSGRQPRFACLTFTFADKSAGPADSFLCLAGWKNKFFKFRLTTRQRKGSEAEARRFVQAWARVLWPAPKQRTALP